MRYKLLGNSGLRVSEVCLGTMSFGEEWGFGADEYESRRIAEAYAEAGGNFIDTSNRYHDGESEQYVGEVIRDERDYWVVGTKYTLAMDPGDPNAAGNSRKNMIRALESSLRRMRTDYIDVLWVNAWDFATPVEEVMRGLDDLVRNGKVLYVGIANTPAWVIAQANTLAAMRNWVPFIGIQLQYNLVERTSERELMPMARSSGLGMLAWAPLAGGVLTGKYTRTGESDTKRAALNEGRLTEHNLTIAREVDAVADELGRTSAQVALNWVRQRGRDLVPIVGVRKMAQLEDLLKALNFELPEEQMQRLDEVSEIELGFPHDWLADPEMRKDLYGDAELMLDLPPAARGH